MPLATRTLTGALLTPDGDAAPNARVVVRFNVPGVQDLTEGATLVGPFEVDLDPATGEWSAVVPVTGVDEIAPAGAVIEVIESWGDIARRYSRSTLVEVPAGTGAVAFTDLAVLDEAPALTAYATPGYVAAAIEAAVPGAVATALEPYATTAELDSAVADVEAAIEVVAADDTVARAFVPARVPDAGVTLLGALTSDATTDLAAFLASNSSNQSSISTWGTFVGNNGTFALALSRAATVNATIGHVVPVEIAWAFPGTAGQIGIAQGVDDDYIIARANELRAYGGPVLLRLNWEMQGDWFPWSYYDDDTPVPGNEPVNYREAWRRVHRIVTQIAPNASFVFCFHLWKYHGIEPSDWYPGDEFVEWVGFTTYPGSADWGWIESGTWGMDTIAQFAEDHDKPLRICEWGAGQGGSGEDVGLFYQLKAWVEAHDVREMCYFHNSGTNGVDYRLERYPDWSYAYRHNLSNNPTRYPQR